MTQCAAPSAPSPSGVVLHCERSAGHGGRHHHTEDGHTYEWSRTPCPWCGAAPEEPHRARCEYGVIDADFEEPYAQPPAVVFTGGRPYAPPILRKIEPTDPIRAAFFEPSDAEVRRELLTLSRQIVTEYEKADQLEPSDTRKEALDRIADAAVQCTIALKDYLEAIEKKETLR